MNATAQIDADTATCPDCNNKGMVTCHHIGTGRDEDDWCTECDSPADEPGRANCQTCIEW